MLMVGHPKTRRAIVTLFESPLLPSPLPTQFSCQSFLRISCFFSLLSSYYATATGGLLHPPCR